MLLLRKALYRFLGLRGYLKLVSRSYISLTRRGAFKEQYPELFYLDRLIRKGDVCVDIGANLGYYSVRMSGLCGPEGRVWAVEPVPLFAEILASNLSRYAGENVTIIRAALGAKQGTVEMGTPAVEGIVRHGRTQVIGEGERAYAQVYQVPLEVPDELFADLQRLDYVKCDVEGYEGVVFPAFRRVLARFMPTVQVEISGEENRYTLFTLLEGLGYSAAVLRSGKLEPVSLSESFQVHGHDFYFLPPGKASGR